MHRLILLVIVSCLCAGVAEAQIKKGAVLLGGDIGLSFQKTKNTQTNGAVNDTKASYVYVSPVFGKAIKDNLILGVDADFIYNQNNASSPIQKQYTYGLDVFVRKYTTLGKGFYLFVQTSAGGFYTTEQAINGAEISTKRYGAVINVYPGVSYALTRKLQLETGFNNLANLSFNHSKETNNGNGGSTSVSNSISLSSSLSSLSGFVLGLRVLLN